MIARSVPRACALLALIAMVLGCDDGQPQGDPDFGDLAVVDATIDAEPVVEARVQIVTPTAEAIITGADDLDGAARDGVRITVVVEAEGADAPIVTLSAGESSTVAPIEDGVAAGTLVLPADADERVSIEARITADGAPVIDVIDVRVQVRACALAVQPQPGGGCDAGAGADLDPDTPGVQIAARIATDCPTVEVTVDGQSTTIEGIEGEAEVVLTLDDGETRVELRAEGADARDGALGPLTYQARTRPPTVSLDLRAAQNVRSLDPDDDPAVLDDRVSWAIAGQSDGLEPDTEVTLVFDPPLAEPVAPVRTDPDGRFAVEVAVPVDGFWQGEITATAVDACGTPSPGSTYPLILDAVVPRAHITVPEDGARILLTDDVDPDREGIQVPMLVGVDDDRPGVDYRVSVACGPVGSSGFDRAPGDASTLRDPVPIIVTFGEDERGEVICRPLLEAGPNPPLVESSTFTLFVAEPTFTIETPLQGTCRNEDVVRLEGSGDDLDGNDPALQVEIVRGEVGAERPVVPLERVGDGRYGVDLGPDLLPDGAYRLYVSGTVFGAVPIQVEPEERTFRVDRVGPEVRFVAPASPFLADEDPATAGFQVRPIIEVCGAGGRPLSVDVDPPVDGGPFDLVVPGGDACSRVALPAFDAPLGPIRLTARVADDCGNETTVRLTSRIDPGVVQASITAPADGSGIDAALDGDADRAGCQIDLDGLVSGLGPDAAYVVCSSAGGGPLDPDCAGERSALDAPCVIMGVAEAGTSIRCPLDLPDGAHTMTLVARDNARIVSEPITVQVDCTPPEVTTLVVQDDADGNGCVDGLERQNPEAAADAARITAAFTVEGLADGTAVRVRTEGGLDLGATDVQGGAGQVTGVLPAGLHRLYVRGQDAAGNPLPEPGDGPLIRAIEVDTRAPTPSLIGLEAGTCLAAADDVDAGNAGLQTDLRIQSGRGPTEDVRVTVAVDGRLVDSRLGALDLVVVDGLDLAEGDRALIVTVADACGNVGSVAGFEQENDLPNPDRPRGLAVRVDTTAPTLTLQGVADGAVLTGDDDADGTLRNGFQIDLVVQQRGLEVGRPVEVEADGRPAVMDPMPLVVAAPDGDLAATLTASAGRQVLVARATDACGNPGASAPVAVTVDIAGCSSRIVGLEDGTIFTAADPRLNGGLTVDAEVDLVDPRCVGAAAELLRDGAPIAAGQVSPEGTVRFAGVDLVPGDQSLALRVTAEADVLDSPAVRVVLDTATPAVRIIRPAGPDPATVLSDDLPQRPGQQITVQFEVTEARVDSAREAELRVDGEVVGVTAVPDDRPAIADFADVTIPSGPHVIEVCVTDVAGQTGCGRREVEADPAAPGGIGPVQVTIVDARATTVTFEFTAPGDDGALGAVTAYAVRRADAPFVDEADWAAAEATEVILPAIAPAGEDETLTLDGPGPTLADGLSLDVDHAVAIRAVDDADRTGPFSAVEVDLRLGRTTARVPPRGGAWEAGDIINTTSPVAGVGDLDRDGFDDLVIAVTQSASATAAAFVFGGPDPETVSLELAPGMGEPFFGVVATSAGDLNGDGALDVAVQGYLDGFAGSAIALYFGCAVEPCDRAELVAPDALVVSVGGRFTNALAGVGDVWKPTGDGFDDLLVGGALAGENTAFVVAGRAEWPALPDVVDVGPGSEDPLVAIVTVPEGPAGVYGAGVGDLNGDGFDEFVLSAGADIDRSYLFYGSPWPGAVRFDPDNADTVALVDPCPGPNSTFGTAFVGGVDLDGDMGARPDFVVGNRSNKRVVIFDSEQTDLDCFGRSPVRFGQFVDHAGDIDGDGAIDLVVTHGDPAVTDAYIFYNDGQGRFGHGAIESPRGADVVLDQPARRKLGVAGAGDFDGDGRPDVAAVYLDEAGMNWIVYD